VPDVHDSSSEDGALTSKLLEINSALTSSLVNRVTEILEHINSSIENQGKIDRKLLEGVTELLEDVKELLSSSKTIPPDIQETIYLLETFLNEDRPYHRDDKQDVLIFIRRATSVISRWTTQEKNELIDALEGAPAKLIKMRTRLKRLYYIVCTAGLITIIAEAGAPEWLQKLSKLIFGG